MENHKRNKRKSRSTQGKTHTTSLINNQYSSDSKILLTNSMNTLQMLETH